jgi:hypothetical protein
MLGGSWRGCAGGPADGAVDTSVIAGYLIRRPGAAR